MERRPRDSCMLHLYISTSRGRHADSRGQFGTFEKYAQGKTRLFPRSKTLHPILFLVVSLRGCIVICVLLARVCVCVCVVVTACLYIHADKENFILSFEVMEANFFVI